MVLEAILHRSAFVVAGVWQGVADTDGALGDKGLGIQGHQRVQLERVVRDSDSENRAKSADSESLLTLVSMESNLAKARANLFVLVQNEDCDGVIFSERVDHILVCCFVGNVNKFGGNLAVGKNFFLAKLFELDPIR